MPSTSVPRWMVRGVVLAVVLSWLPLALIARNWVTRSDRPRVHIFQDMDKQPKFKSQEVNPIFADGRAMRPVVPGTVARGRLGENLHLEQGKVGGRWAETFPMEITESFVRRGQERFNVFCAPCHGLGGEGDGPISVRALEKQEPRWVPPTALTSEMVRDREVGHLFNSITHGIRNMPGHGTQIPVADRWAIVSYLRALQLSRNASLEDVPPGRRDALQ